SSPSPPTQVGVIDSNRISHIHAPTLKIGKRKVLGKLIAPGMDMRKLLPCGTKMHGTLIPLPLSSNCSRLGYFHRLFPIIGQGNRTVPLERHHPPCTHHVILHGPRIPRTGCNGIIAYPEKLTDRSPDS